MKAARAKRTNRDIERHYFEQFRRAYTLPDGTVSYCDKPDVTLTGERKIGIEITRFYLQSGACLASDQRQQPLRTAIVAKAHALFRAQGGKGFELTIDFDRRHPITSTSPRSRKLPGELVALANRIDPARATGALNRRKLSAIPEISDVYFIAREFLDEKWHVIGNYSVERMSPEALKGIIREKEAKSVEYEPRDAYWLLVVVDPIDPAQEQEIRLDGLSIPSNVFEKILVYKPKFEHIVEVNVS